jgi:hypothetical protein
MQRASEFIYKRKLNCFKSHCSGGTEPLIDIMTCINFLVGGLGKDKPPYVS